MNAAIRKGARTPLEKYKNKQAIRKIIIAITKILFFDDSVIIFPILSLGGKFK
ncbi:hypothetical protein AGMMS49936_03250 [Endomicrobiia bacterium]|nr:hypothetical protein AGMMS49936_03250 [Endomicrobiia bacterium]